eukprot:GHUV01045311.1.p2 GENE.GHUV01045311.1~~GHUV01045311.1.p2  ORF type:complete len:118 (-),score=29.97 GHUV01045311.1:51-404(-)
MQSLSKLLQRIGVRHVLHRVVHMQLKQHAVTASSADASGDRNSSRSVLHVLKNEHTGPSGSASTCVDISGGAATMVCMVVFHNFSAAVSSSEQIEGANLQQSLFGDHCLVIDALHLA